MVKFKCDGCERGCDADKVENWRTTTFSTVSYGNVCFTVADKETLCPTCWAKMMASLPRKKGK